MLPRFLAVVMVAGACGEVANPPSDGSTSITYKGVLDQTSPVMFGGSPYCSYSIVLKQLDVEIGIQPSSKQVTSGQVQDLNVETVLPTTPACPYGPADPTISNYKFASAMPSTSGMTLMFQGAANNTPATTLEITLSPSGLGYTAALKFHRTDEPPPLDWSVAVTIPLPMK